MSKLRKLAHERAMKETREALKLTEDRIVIGVLLWGVWLFFVWMFKSGEDRWKSIRMKLVVALAPLLIFPIVYAIKFVASMDKLYDEAATRGEELTARIEKQPHLRLSYAADKTIRRGGGLDQTFLYAENEAGRDIIGAQVKIDGAFFRENGSSNWQGTSIVARPNMSWGFLPDGDAMKYLTMNLPHGKEIIDFVSGPRTANKEDPQLGFVIRIDPRQRMHVNPFFSKPGTYKFSMQVSAPNVEKPGKLILLVDWDGRQVKVRSDEEPSQVLDVI